ncbi:MAG: hypothetical protein ABW056_12165 [Thermoanaerobaculia bacterium]
MRPLLAFLAGSLVLAAALSAAPCAPSPTTLCLNDSRFEVEVSWRDSRGRTGVGQAKSITADTGYFWFFSEANIELVIKVLDARSINQKYWVFFGALSAVEYDLTVTDTSSGRSKTYHNALGQFASVGDTSAFDPSAVSPAHETVTAEGASDPPASFEALQAFIDAASATAPSAAAFTPCPETLHGFNLNGCRFHLQVSWRDARGRTGVGQPVQLTNDTGYFWFFSPANVELVVKVLDARSVNGKFWVFFGALTNVEYTLSVKDTLTGALASYANPSGTFASVGDTSAFRGGYSVVSVLDPGHAGSANLDNKGGIVTATGADGSVFTLDVPPDALWSPETVTLTPVTRIDRFPFSGGLIAGVEIEPQGLALGVPATLTIRPASPPPADRTIPYSYSRGGEDFILHPHDLDNPSLRLPVFRLGGYGAGQGAVEEASSRLDNVPTAPLSPYLQRYAYELFLRALGRISQAELGQRGTQIYREAFEQVVAPLLGVPPASTVRAASRKEATCDLGDEDLSTAIAALIGIIQQKQIMGVVNDETGEVDTGLEEALEQLRACALVSFNQCKQFNDPFEALRLVQIARQLQILGVEDPLLTSFAPGSLVERCLRFELDFESRLVGEFHVPKVGVSATRMKYRAHVPLRFNYAGNEDADRSIWEGTCTLVPEFAELELSTGLGDCTLAINPYEGFFNAATVWIGLWEFWDNPVKVRYWPGEPNVSAILTCDEIPVDFHVFQFAGQYSFFHHGDRSSNGFYLAKDFQLQRLPGEYLALKPYERTIPDDEAIWTEETWFFLKHTPDAPMPDCP